MLIGDKALQDCNHEALIKWVDNTHKRNLMLFNVDLEDREVHILLYFRSAPIHLLHEFPNTVIYYEVIFFLLYVSSDHVLVVEQFCVVDAS